MKLINCKKSISLILAMLLTSMYAASCGSTSAGNSGETSGQTQTDTTVPEETKEVAEIPDVKYDGYQFRILGQTPATGSTNDEIYAESETGDMLNDAVYQRNTMVEDKLGIEIVKIESDDIAGDLSKSVMANEDAYDASVNVIAYTRSALTSGYLLSLDDLPYIDISKSWWKQDVIESFSIAGKMFMMFGDILYSDKNATWALCFNKNLYEEYGLGDPYSIVREGKWTLDVFAEHCKDITKDLDGNSTLDKNDQWGLLSSTTAGIGLVTSCGIFTTTAESNGSLTFNLENERSINALGKINELMNDRSMQLRAEDIGGSSMWTDIINIFREGRALYRISIMTDIATLRDMEDDFGILPLPKYDENQDEYYTTYQGWNARSYVVPVTVSDRERTSAILEYMASVSPDTMTKAYYDVTLQRKVARDDDSSEMLDIIFNSVTTDIALALDLGSIRTKLISMINSTSNTIASDIASSKESIQAELDKVYDGVSSLG